MRAGEILLAGNSRFVRRADERVPDEPVHAFAQRLVERRFQVVPDFFLPVRPDGREALILRNRVAVSVRGARGLLDEKTVFFADAVRPRPRPKFAHRHVVPAEAALRINRHGMRAAAFGMDFQAVLVRVIAKQPIVIVNREVA